MCCQRSKVTLRTGYKWEPVFRDLILEHAENLCSLTSPENDDVSMIIQAASFSISKSPTIYIKCVHAYTCRYECIHKTRYSVCVKICCVHSFFNDFNGDTFFEGTASSVKAFLQKICSTLFKKYKSHSTRKTYSRWKEIKEKWQPNVLGDLDQILWRGNTVHSMP